jgi:hypothetical protein
MNEERLPCNLNDSVLRYVGGTLCARPVYGWGWGVTGGSPVDVPQVFHFRLESLFDWNNERRGGIGLVQQPGHPYDGWWFLFYTRLCGLFDFDSTITDYNFHLGINKPGLHSPNHDPLMATCWPLPNFVNCESIWGFGRIAATHEIIVNFEEARIRECDNKGET